MDNKRKRRVVRRGFSGSEYLIRIRYRAGSRQRLGQAIKPGHGVMFPIGTSAVFVLNGGTFTWAHVHVKRERG